MFIWGGISSDIWLEIYFYGDAGAEPLNIISERISSDIPPQMIILNMVVPILMCFYSLISNWRVASRTKAYVIQQNVT